eukprot:scaffold145636_cov22-Tisochrysis_lutea.AAC.3
MQQARLKHLCSRYERHDLGVLMERAAHAACMRALQQQGASSDDDNSSDDEDGSSDVAGSAGTDSGLATSTGAGVASNGAVQNPSPSAQ